MMMTRQELSEFLGREVSKQEYRRLWRENEGKCLTREDNWRLDWNWDQRPFVPRTMRDASRGDTQADLTGRLEASPWGDIGMPTFSQ